MDQQIEIMVSYIGAAKPKQFTWDKTIKVGEAADEAAEEFGISTEQPPTFQLQDSTVLDRNRPLVSYGIESGTTLELVASGGGV